MRRYFLKLIRRRKLRADLETELAHHREMAEQHGNPVGLGNTAKIREESLDLWRFNLLENFLRDLSYAARQLRNSPTFTATAVLSLALGISLTVCIFTLLNAVALRPLPYSDPARLVWMTQILKSNSTDDITITPDFLNWRDQNHTFTDLAAYNQIASNLSGAAEPRQINVIKASAALLPMLGVQPFLGRNFRRKEDLKGNDLVALLSHKLWQQQFAGDKNVIGRPITLDDVQYTIVGVLPASFVFPGPEPVEVIIPLGKDEATELQRNPNGPLTLVRNVVGRLRPGVTLAQAHADLTIIQSHLPKLGFIPTITIEMVPLREHLFGNAKLAGFILIGAAAFLLLIAAANVSNLLLVRLIQRDREFAVRAALGGSRQRIFVQLLTEGSLLGVFGCGIGLVLAFFIRGPLFRLSPYRTADLSSLPFDWRVLAFAIGLSFITTLAFAAVPALRATETRLGQAMKIAHSSVSDNRQSFRMLSLIAIAEIATILILSSGAGLLIESFWKMRHSDLGFQPDRLVAAIVHLSGRKYRDQAQRSTFIKSLLAQTKALPGVSAAAVVNAGEIPPGGGHATNTFRIEGHVLPVWSRHKPIARQEDVSADYLRIMQIPLIAGRYLRDSDVETNSTPVALVNEAVVRRFFDGKNPIGDRIKAGSPWSTVVGVVGDVKTSGLAAAPEPTLYFPFSRRDTDFSELGIVMQSGLGTATVAAEFREALHRTDSSQPLVSIQLMNSRLNESAAKPRFTAVLLSGFAMLALAIGLIGVYGVMSCRVRSQRRELAVRQAVGAERKHIVSQVLLESGRIIVPGACAGLLGSLALSRFLASLLYETKPTDPLLLSAVCASIIAVATIACLIPAIDAAQADPLDSLRQD